MWMDIHKSGLSALPGPGVVAVDGVMEARRQLLRASLRPAKLRLPEEEHCCQFQSVEGLLMVLSAARSRSKSSMNDDGAQVLSGAFTVALTTCPTITTIVASLSVIIVLPDHPTSSKSVRGGPLRTCLQLH